MMMLNGRAGLMGLVAYTCYFENDSTVMETSPEGLKYFRNTAHHNPLKSN